MKRLFVRYLHKSSQGFTFSVPKGGSGAQIGSSGRKKGPPTVARKPSKSSKRRGSALAPDVLT